MQSTFTHYCDSPTGMLRIEATISHVTSIYFLSDDDVQEPNPNLLCREAASQLNAFFEGGLTVFDLPLRPSGTEFQHRVWNQLHKIPYGETISYGTLAKQLGDPNLVRAVGAANGKNPIAIIAPCHRVIGSNGNLIGYAGGLERKSWLLSHEKRASKTQLSLFNSLS